MVTKKWTREACYKEAKKYKTRGKFQKGNGSAYNAARRNGWMDDYDWFETVHKPNGYWTLEKCEEMALKCKTRSEMAKKYPCAYQVALKKELLDNYDWLSPSATNSGHSKYTKEICFEIAIGCKTKTEMKKKNPRAYIVSINNNWIKDYTWFVNGCIDYTKEMCFEIAKKYKTVKEFRKKNEYVYRLTLKNGWFDNYTWFTRMDAFEARKNDNVYGFFFNEIHTVYIGRTINIEQRSEYHYTKEGSAVYKFAKQNNIQIPEITVLESGLTLDEGLEKEDYYVNKYREEGWTVLNKAKTGKRSGSLGSLGSYKLTRKKCYELSLDCKTRTEFAKKHQTAYAKSKRKGWIEDFKHLAMPSIGGTVWKWTDSRILEEANKYDTYSDFRKQSRKAYQAAIKRGLLSEIKAYYDKRA